MKKSSFWAELLTKDMLILVAMGVSSGLPLALTGGTLQAWLKNEGVDLGTIGLFAVVGLPYSLKFLWSPLMDRYVPLKMGRRRSWMIITQLMLIFSVIGLGFAQPKINLSLIALLAVLVSFFSASQDIVLDAWRREKLTDSQLGFGTSVFVSSYLFSFRMIAGSLALILADHFPWSDVYLTMAAMLSVGLLATFFCQEPNVDVVPPKTLRDAVIEPFKDFFTKPGAITILIFILAYKLGDNMALQMTTPFYLEVGFSKTDIGEINKLTGWVALVIGQILGGVLMKKIGIIKSLLWFGILQGLAVYSFAILTWTGKNIFALATIIGFENLAIGMGTIAYVTYMASITNRKFTATQYALLSSLMGLPRTLIAAPTGYLAKFFGWHNFFMICSLMAIPGLLLIAKLKKIEKA